MIVMDTHIWLWWVNGDLNQLGAKRVKLLQQTIPLAVSAISCFEIAWLDQHRQIILPKIKQIGLTKPLRGLIFYSYRLSQRLPK